MPNPAFVPIIGSGFDSLAGQTQYWSGFNKSADESNMRRAALAEQAANNWFTQRAQMQQHEAARSDAIQMARAEEERRAAADRINLGLGLKSEAENTRRFGLEFGLKQRQVKAQEDLLKEEKMRQERMIGDYAENLQPTLNEIGRKYETAQQEHDKAVAAIATRMANAEADPAFPKAKVMFSKATNQFEIRANPLTRQPETLTPEEAEAVKAANRALGETNAEYMQAKTKFETLGNEWKLINSQAGKWNLLPVRSGSGWVLRSPELGKTFGKMVEEARGEEGPPAEPQPFIPAAGTLGAAMREWRPVSPEVTGASQSFTPSTGQPVTKVWVRTPSGALVPATQ